MKKTLLSICILISTMTIASAQLLPTFQLGIKGGLNFSSLKTDENWFDKSSRTGYQAGLWARIGGAGFHFQPELYITGKNAEAKLTDENNAQVDFNFTSLDLPLLLGTRIGLGPIAARVQVGPVISFLIDKDNSIFDRIGDATRPGSYRNQAIALTGGVGVDIMKFRADLRYEHGLSSLTKDGAESQKINLWTIGVGYRLF
ncbi:porin family protein [Olivibacter sp. CPCC 100613]|uniref:porin family protein n=1 Tax=Olivibacter sp. CPCC 100613 TaxID=3079931 RepID=UPI002FF7E1FB